MRRSSDAAIVGQLLGLHYREPPRLLDATWGGGRMWRGCSFQPTTRFDARPLPGVDVVGEWQQLPQLFEPGAFQALVWDPPHLADGTDRAMSGTWDVRYGIGSERMRGHANINHLYEPFLAAARGLLASGGMLLAKIADQVHSSVQQLQAVDFVVAARGAGWTVCEMVPKMRPPGPLDPKWRRQYHVRKAWSYWICAHPGPICPATGISLVRPCHVCGREFGARRSHARTCGDACRQRLRYHRNLTDSRRAAQKQSVSFGGPISANGRA